MDRKSEHGDGSTNWHIHTGATFYLTLQGLFEGIINVEPPSWAKVAE